MHPVRGFLGLARGGEDGAGVIFKNHEPRADVGGVIQTRMVRDAEIGQDHPAEQLNGDFFHGVCS